MVVVEQSIKELEGMLAKRTDIPKEFPDISKIPRTPFREYGIHIHHTWEIEPDNGSLYPTSDSFAPYLEII